MAEIIDGAKIAREIEAKLIIPAPAPCLAVIVFKDDRAGELYSRLKSEAAQRLGINFLKLEFNFEERERLTQSLKRVSADLKIHGVMIQRPGFGWGQKHGLKREEFETWWDQLVELIAPAKDVDGLRPDSRFVPATVKAVELILRRLQASGKTVVVGSKGLVGRKLAERLRAIGVDIESDSLAGITREADVLISATGQPKLIKADMVKPGAVVIDVGWPKGDADFDAVKAVAGAITPVPGGVGPVTVVCLLENLLLAV